MLYMDIYMNIYICIKIYIIVKFSKFKTFFEQHKNSPSVHLSLIHCQDSQ